MGYLRTFNEMYGLKPGDSIDVTNIKCPLMRKCMAEVYNKAFEEWLKSEKEEPLIA